MTSFDAHRGVRTRVDVLLRRAAPTTDQPGLVADDVTLGPDGLGLDSIAMVELLLACEQEFGIRLPPTLFEEGTLTVGALVRAVTHVNDARDLP